MIPPTKARTVFQRNVILNNGKAERSPAVIVGGHHHNLVFRANTIGHESPSDRERIGMLVSSSAKNIDASGNRFLNVETEIFRE